MLVLGSPAAATPSRLTVHIAVSHDHRTTRYTLLCGPAGGTIPEAGRLCRDIAAHPLPMLDPGRRRSVCAGAVGAPILTVSSTRRGRPTSFAGQPGCGWPGGTALAVYWAAASRDVRTLELLEPRLRCDDDPALLAEPTPWRSVFACTHGLWTPRTARLIRIAERVPAIAELRPRSLFPAQIGTRRCRIHGGGLCEVEVTHVWSSPRVAFTESWSSGRRTWVVTIAHGRGRLTAR